ncbi:peptide/nickel transport system ATP-binding protein [Cytobacillus horneckiae]|uniref:Dipeptide ABC transporter ATP-binding protein n=1 Tax=Cytobacillus horneckiae TaxID=549687 RepID=A0A2N0ZFI6_9BACI|nr:dipeptide ABC transporter ATP-binding protein [Cytobacillus horneckiae]MBN6885186.1 dipeptide ABC transporter ATP-binding protein [Cytobacillus horneckiae]MCM3179069.1 dipeptide ABC transporter ATP-binding protein [Cytobacillus horneckiae]MEC1154286.1 dipeptide ABC transporter ATP-binding protein [Cytobacillus horneckiae]MED2937622.1 dipeptide ABC transporter ATP-binding protein [Cytobacillus horneckiae]PKG28272.1 dipeptide ABC transporter ATP-binding protein [Cytobacillus horneckiae]
MMKQKVLLSVNNLKKYYDIPQGLFKEKIIVKAVDDISFTITKGETFALVGESGCGKSTTGRTILKLTEPTGGRIIFDGNDIAALPYKKMRTLRNRMQMVFQDPYASLNPKKTVREILTEPLRVHKKFDHDTRLKKVKSMLEIVGLSEYHLDRYPHEFSGGQRQRIGIARAVILQPDFIIADEPVSALDVSVQSQVINLMLELQKEFELTYLFISHDLSVIQHMTDRVAVMYLGKIVEIAKTEDLFTNPKHPYTKALLSAVPITHPKEKKERIILKGDVPSPANPPSGCTFHPRCPAALDICKTQAPKTSEHGNSHSVSCHLYNKIEEEIPHAISHS